MTVGFVPKGDQMRMTKFRVLHAEREGVYSKNARIANGERANVSATHLLCNDADQNGEGLFLSERN